MKRFAEPFFRCLHKLQEAGKITSFPVKSYLAATSVGIIEELGAVLDLNYHEDSRALVDMNVIMTGAEEFVELQGTGEEATFTRAQLNELLDLATAGINQLFESQKEALGPIAEKIK